MSIKILIKNKYNNKLEEIVRNYPNRYHSENDTVKVIMTWKNLKLT